MTPDDFSDLLVLLVEVNNLISHRYFSRVYVRGQDGRTTDLQTSAADVDKSTYVLEDGKFLMTYRSL